MDNTNSRVHAGLQCPECYGVRISPRRDDDRLTGTRKWLCARNVAVNGQLHRETNNGRPLWQELTRLWDEHYAANEAELDGLDFPDPQ